MSAIPFGRNVIYLNTLTQLAHSAIDFTKVEAQCFMLQTIQQTGISGNDFKRTNHAAISKEAFGCAMLEQLGFALQRMSENWESWRAYASYSLLVRRLSSLTKSEQVHRRALACLAEIRSICFKWLLKVKQRAATSTEDEQRSDMYSRATEIALLCTSTYDVEETDFDIVLQQDSAIFMLIQCSITIQENGSSVRSEDQGLYRVMLQAHRVLMHRLFRNLRKFILQDSTGLCDAVTASWTAFHPTVATKWCSLDTPQEHWLLIKSGTLLVHFNLLTADLLIDGLPLSRLPSEFVQHEMYKPLFSKSTLEVVPTDEPGLQFSAKYPYHQYKLHFGMQDSDMLVVAMSPNSR